MIKLFRTVCLVCALFAISACNRAPNPSLATPQIAKVAVSRDGEIRLNGTVISVEELDREFGQLAPKHGVVWLYFETKNGDGHPLADQVSRMIMDRKLAVKLASTPDYSQWIID